MNSTTMDITVYLIGQLNEDGDVKLPLASHTLFFISQYCKQRDLKFVFVKGQECETFVQIPSCALRGLNTEFTQQSTLPQTIMNVTLPSIYDKQDGMIRSGLCNTARRIISIADSLNPDDGYSALLGFREGSCKACAEMSGWTKLCEVELPEDLQELIGQMRSRLKGESPNHSRNIQLPLNLVKLEKHFSKPPIVHNYNKFKIKLLKMLKKDKKTVAQWIIDENLISDHGIIEFQREEICDHWTLRYHVLKQCRLKTSMPEEIVLLKNLSMLNRNKSSDQKMDERHHISEHKGTESLLSAIMSFIDTLKESDIHFEHLYSEGIMMTVADVLLFPYIYLLMESTNFRFHLIRQSLPEICAWFHHMLSLEKIKEASIDIGFNFEKIKSPEILYNSEDSMEFSVPEIDEDTGSDFELSRVRKTKFKALKPEVTETLNIFKNEEILPVLGDHPAGEKTTLDWKNFPSAVHPSEGGLPEKRKLRKCQQLESLVTAVLEIAKPGNVIADFCSGGGHLGIVIAFLLPDCQVYLIENKEQSLLGAKKRIVDLQLKNVTLYQCNMDYFHGKFDIGVCLHACGVATDMVQEQCLNNSASFVICPCCYGSVQNTHIITYPRSSFFKNKGITDKDLITVGHAADQTEINIKLQEQGKYCMNLVDTDRLHAAREKGYSVTLCSLKPLSCTTKNNMLVGVR